MRFAIAVLVSALLGSSLTGSAYAQAASRFETNSLPLSRPQKGVLVIIPDSIRRKVGYQHWKGGAIGGSVGALRLSGGSRIADVPVGNRDGGYDLGALRVTRVPC